MRKETTGASNLKWWLFASCACFQNTYILHSPPHATRQLVLTSRKGTKVDTKVIINSTDGCSNGCVTGRSQLPLASADLLPLVLNLLET